MTPQFRPDLYRGTAEFYDRYRPPYPDALFDDVRARVPVSGTGRLLDLACGTGQIAVPLAADFSQVVAVDLEPEFVEFVNAKAERLGLPHVRAVAGRAEEVALAPPFELIAIGNAFHRLDRDRVAARCVELLQPGGCVALLWGSSTWADARKQWQRSMDDVLNVWMERVDATDRIPPDWEEAITRHPHEEALTGAGLGYVGAFEFAVTIERTVDELIGLVYSTSFLNRSALGGAVDDFEQDFERALRECEPAGVFVEDGWFKYELARLS